MEENKNGFCGSYTAVPQNFLKGEDMMEKTPSSVEIPAAADNAEESIKCPYCGAMFGVGMAGAPGQEKNGALVKCPVCQRQIDPAKAEKLGASNEGY